MSAFDIDWGAGDDAGGGAAELGPQPLWLAGLDDNVTPGTTGTHRQPTASHSAKTTASVDLDAAQAMPERAPAMNTVEFLRAFLPSRGVYVIGTGPHLKKDGSETLYNEPFTNIEDAAAFVVKHRDVTNVFFATQSFKDLTEEPDKYGRMRKRVKRTQENALCTRLFPIDWDVGESKLRVLKYPTRDQAEQAMCGFVAATMLPTPSKIYSGNGLHTYWRLTEDISTDIWQPVAEKIQRLLDHHGALVDRAVTTDSARYLRPIHTKNHKDPANPKPVKLAHLAPPVDFAALVAAIDDATAAARLAPAAPTLAHQAAQAGAAVAGGGALAGVREGFFPAVNALALASLGTWVTALLPAARPSGTGYRVTSKALGRDLDEDLSITSQGIVDFGVADMGDARQGKRSAVDLVVEHGAAVDVSDAKGAAFWLCERLEVTPESLGWEASAPPLPPAEWAEPKLIPSGLLPVDRFDPAMVPEAVAPWIMDVAERMQCPPDFVAVTMMVGLGSVLGRKIAVRPQRRTDWFEVPNLWGCIVGRPGAKKSPAMSEALRPVERLEAEARKMNAEAQALHEHALAEHKLKQEVATKAAREAAKGKGPPAGPLVFDKPEPPKIKRYKCNDTTYEALGVILADNPNGVMVFRDELVSLLKTLDREDNAAARGFYLTAWSGVSGYTFDRIMRGVTHIDAACLSLLGGTQPGKLAAYVGRALGGGEGDDGMMQRFSLLVWPDDDAPFVEVDRYPDSAAKEAAFKAVVRLDALTPDTVGAEQGDFDALPFLRLDEGAGTLFSGWHVDLEGRLRSGALHAAMASHLSKFKKLVPALALINHLADGGTGPVTEAAMRRALRFAAYLESHARRAYGSGRQAEVGAAKAILQRIRRGDLPAEFTARDVLRHEWSDLSDQGQVKGGLDLLDDLGWVRSRRLDTGGRPKMLFTPHPKLVRSPDPGGG